MRCSFSRAWVTESSFLPSRQKRNEFETLAGGARLCRFLIFRLRFIVLCVPFFFFFAQQKLGRWRKKDGAFFLLVNSSSSPSLAYEEQGESARKARPPQDQGVRRREARADGGVRPHRRDRPLPPPVRAARRSVRLLSRGGRLTAVVTVWHVLLYIPLTPCSTGKEEDNKPVQQHPLTHRLFPLQMYHRKHVQQSIFFFSGIFVFIISRWPQPTTNCSSKRAPLISRWPLTDCCGCMYCCCCCCCTYR